ncbi:MAG: hypothetical protein PHD37_10770 [Gallionellaceae bacterium]|nr:hypothetical protein [Gallionellaceae bacterium]
MKNNNDVTIGVNKEYKKYFNYFYKAYSEKLEVSNVLNRCGLNIKEYNVFYLDFANYLAVVVNKGNGFYVEDIKNFGGV